MSKYDITRYTQFKIGYLVFPACIHISKIEDSDYTLPTRKASKLEIVGNDIIRSEIDDFFYGKFEKENQIRYIVNLIYRFIDFGLIEEQQIEVLNINNNEFKDYCINHSSVSLEDLSKCYDEILLQIASIKKEFVDMLINDFDIYRSFPKLPSFPDDGKYETPKEYVEYLQFTRAIIDAKACLEYSGEIIFEENIGKAYNNFSWREKEFRKLYTTAVTNIDNFSEQVKSYIQKRALND